jgi:hypothetical protein
MTNIIQESFGVNLSVLKALYLYTSEKATRSYKVRAFVIYFLFIFYVPILGMLYFVLEENIDMKRVGDNAFVLAEVCCYTTKLLPFITKAQRIKNCIHYFESPHFVTFGKNQKIIIDDCVSICKRNSWIFIISLTGGFLLWAIKPFFLKDYRLPIDVWLPVNLKKQFNNLLLCLCASGFR